MNHRYLVMAHVPSDKAGPISSVDKGQHKRKRFGVRSCYLKPREMGKQARPERCSCPKHQVRLRLREEPHLDSVNKHMRR